MKFLHAAILAAMLIASAHALKCNVGYSAGGQNACVSTDKPLSDTCYKCVSPVALDGSTATPVIYGSSCGPNEFGGMTCAVSKTQCEGTSLKGVYTACKTQNCNSCSPATAIYSSAYLLAAAFVCSLF
jgi:hypothetical protein